MLLVQIMEEQLFVLTVAYLLESYFLAVVLKRPSFNSVSMLRG